MFCSIQPTAVFFSLALTAELLSGCRTTPGAGTVLHQDTIHTSRNALDWAGYYRGLLPGDGDEDVLTELYLNADGTYQMSRRYSDGPEGAAVNRGVFTWDSTGSTIALSGAGGGSSRVFQVRENALAPWDNNRKAVAGDRASRYILNKEKQQVTEMYWKLVELNGRPVRFEEGQKREAHFILKQDKRLIGHGGCNPFNGNYELAAPDRIRFSNIMAAEGACANAANEQAYLGIFERADHYTIRGDTLLLSSARTPLARFQVVYFR